MNILSDGISPELGSEYVGVLQDLAQDSPCFMYAEKAIIHQINKLQSCDFPFGFQVRYAMKANPIRTILQLMDRHNVWIDACSEYEVYRAIDAGIQPHKIQLTGQVLPKNLSDLLERGIKICACSLHQLRMIGEIKPGTTVGIRLNPGSGSGQFPGVNVGGVFSSFGIRHEKISEIKNLEDQYDLRITTLHTHIGSGTNPDVWQNVAKLSLKFSKEFEHLDTVNLGGGFKVSRNLDEKGVKVKEVIVKLKEEFLIHEENTGKKLNLEIEPGTFLMANAGYLIAKVDDIVDTGDAGHDFIKLNIGMSDIIRPIMYGAVHPIWFLSDRHEGAQKQAIIVGHSCESSDMLTVDNKGNPLKRQVPNGVRIGDTVIIGGAGAYCSSMNTKNYNSYPEIAEYLYTADGSIQKIKTRQGVEDIWRLEK